MKLLIKNVIISDPRSALNGEQADILVIDGMIDEIASGISADEDTTLIERENVHACPGFVELFSDFGEPGYEFRETITSGSEAAASGGFTDVFLLPNNHPSTDNRAAVESIKNQAHNVNLHPIGAVSKNVEGRELTEMYDMRVAGVKVFSDGKNAIQNADLLVKAMLYIKPSDAVIVQIPDNKEIAPHGLMNEGIASARFGLAGKPAFAENLMIKRDIEIAAYTKSRLHITGVSTAEGLELINDARQKGIDITCSVTPLHLVYCDEDLADYDTNLKTLTPLRTAKDRDALRLALINGNIDAVAVHHWPQHSDHKDCEFEYAKTGAIGLQTAFAIVNELAGLSRAVELLSLHPAAIAGIEKPEIKKGATASFTLLDPDKKFVFDKNLNRSLSSNSPFLQKELKGFVYGIINNGKYSGT